MSVALDFRRTILIDSRKSLKIRDQVTQHLFVMLEISEVGGNVTMKDRK